MRMTRRRAMATMFGAPIAALLPKRKPDGPDVEFRAAIALAAAEDLGESAWQASFSEPLQIDRYVDSDGGRSIVITTPADGKVIWSSPVGGDMYDGAQAHRDQMMRDHNRRLGHSHP